MIAKENDEKKTQTHTHILPTHMQINIICSKLNCTFEIFIAKDFLSIRLFFFLFPSPSHIHLHSQYPTGNLIK